MIGGISVILAVGVSLCDAQSDRGAEMPWTTYEAETMKSTGTVLGPQYGPHLVEMESSGQRCVKLAAAGQYVAFTAQSASNAMIVRYSLPDAGEGEGTRATLALYRNDEWIEDIAITSQYSWLYGEYPFTNNPKAGKPRNFYDEIRVKGLSIGQGDVVRLERVEEGTADYCIIDLIDLENISPPLKAPPQSISVADVNSGIAGSPDQDCTETLRRCIDEAAITGKSVWLPPGTFRISGDIVVPPMSRFRGRACGTRPSWVMHPNTRLSTDA